MIANNFLLVIASEGGGSLLSVDAGLAFWTTLTFLILLIILGKFAWKPILTALKQRENAIKDSLEQAEKAKEEAKKILEENQANLNKAEEESKKIIEQSRQYAETLKEQLIKESRAQAQKLIDEASVEINRKKDEAFNELKNQIAEISVQAAEKILRQNLNTDSNRKIVDSYISEISKN